MKVIIIYFIKIIAFYKSLIFNKIKIMPPQLKGSFNYNWRHFLIKYKNDMLAILFHIASIFFYKKDTLIYTYKHKND
jgi:hypothetical protein